MLQSEASTFTRDNIPIHASYDADALKSLTCKLDFLIN